MSQKVYAYVDSKLCNSVLLETGMDNSLYKSYPPPPPKKLNICLTKVHTAQIDALHHEQGNATTHLLYQGCWLNQKTRAFPECTWVRVHSSGLFAHQWQRGYRKTTQTDVKVQACVTGSCAPGCGSSDWYITDDGECTAKRHRVSVFLH